METEEAREIREQRPLNKTAGSKGTLKSGRVQVLALLPFRFQCSWAQPSILSASVSFSEKWDLVHLPANTGNATFQGLTIIRLRVTEGH